MISGFKMTQIKKYSCHPSGRFSLVPYFILTNKHRFINDVGENIRRSISDTVFYGAPWYLRPKSPITVKPQVLSMAPQ